MSKILSCLSDAARLTAGRCESRAQKPAALVVDDDPDVPPLVERALARFDIFSDSVDDGAKAIARLRALTYDLVILDLGMPEPNGFEVLQALKKESRLRRIPVLVLTGDNSNDALARSFGCGADDLVVKPFNASELGLRAYRLLHPLANRHALKGN